MYQFKFVFLLGKAYKNNANKIVNNIKYDWFKILNRQAKEQKLEIIFYSLKLNPNKSQLATNLKHCRYVGKLASFKTRVWV